MYINPVDTPTVIEIGKISQFLSSDDISMKSFFGNAYPVEHLPMNIYMATKGTEWAYIHYGSSSTSTNSIAYYLLSLCGKYIGRATTTLGNAEGIIVIPSDNPASYLVTQRFYTQFRIGDSGSPMNAGDTTLAIIDPEIVPESSDGKVNVNVDGLLDPDQLTDQVSVTAVYSLGRFDLTFNTQAMTGMVFKIDYPVRRNLTVSTSVIPVADLTYFATVVDTATETLRNTATNIFTLLAGTINVVGFTMFCVSTTDEIYIQQWTASVKNVGGTITINVSNDSVIQDDFAGLLTVAVTGNNSEQGVEIQVTGISGKTINCRATFTYTSNSL
jgi:hypothetical protein